MEKLPGYDNWKLSDPDESEGVPHEYEVTISNKISNKTECDLLQFVVYAENELEAEELARRTLYNLVTFHIEKS